MQGESKNFYRAVCRVSKSCFTIGLFFRPGRVRMSIVPRGALAVKGLIDADSAAFIATYTVLYISLMFSIEFKTRLILPCAVKLSY